MGSARAANTLSAQYLLTEEVERVSKERKWGICPTCGIETYRTEHHTIWPRRKYASHPMREKLTILLCQECHQAIHDYWRIHNSDNTRYDTEKIPKMRREKFSG